MSQTEAMPLLQEFREFLKAQEPLGPFTVLKIGGPAEVLAQPRSTEELTALVRRCFEKQIPFRVLGGGANVLIREEGVRGVVVRLTSPAFTAVTIQGRMLRAGAGSSLSAFVSQAARNGLAGLETLMGLPGTVGGALRLNAGDRAGEIGSFVRKVEVLDKQGNIQTREQDDLQFGYLSSNLDDPVLLSAEFELETDAAEAIMKRMLKAWIQLRAGQPFSFQAACRMFKNPRGLRAAALIEQGGLVGTRVGGAQVSDRNPNYLIAEPGASSPDVLRLLDLIQSRVEERFHVELEREVSIW